MVIIMSDESTKDDVQRVIVEVERRGYQSHPIYGDTRTIVGVIGWKPNENHLEHFRSLRGVEDAIPIAKRYKRTHRHFQIIWKDEVGKRCRFFRIFDAEDDLDVGGVLHRFEDVQPC